MQNEMRPSRKFSTINIGIICEGTKTENNYYFQMFKNEPDLKDINYRIIPKEEDSGSIIRANNKRPKKSLRTSELYIYHELEDRSKNEYDTYKSQPLRYVREAYLLKEDYGYNDVWAVFDRDGHSSLQTAFEKAKEWGVNIAFSSLAFEQWVLLHFEKSIKKFEVVACRKGKEVIECNSKRPCINPDKECLCGYIRRKYLPSYDKNCESLYLKLQPRLKMALENSAWLQYKSCNKELYKLDPYCNMDKLIVHIMNIVGNNIENIKWFAPFNIITIDKGITITVAISDDNVILSIINYSEITLLLPDTSVSLSDEYGENKQNYQRIIVSSNDSKDYNIKRTNNSYFQLNITYKSVIYICDLRS